MQKAYRNLSAARELFHLGFYEDSVGKSYYAILTAMRALLSLRHQDSKTHGGVITLFHRHFVKERLFPQRFNKIFARLRKLREDADYGDYVSISKELAEKEMQDADEFLRVAESVMVKLLSEE
jgi:uncharacterized protein (UPF0332 family)